jgi:hypothetical protein
MKRMTNTSKHMALPIAYGHPKNKEYVADVISMLASGAILVTFKAARTYLVLPNNIDPANIVPPIKPRFGSGCGCGSGGGGGRGSSLS